MFAVFLLLLILSVLGCAGALRRWLPKAWPACALLGALVAAAALLGKPGQIAEAPVPVLIAALASAALAALVAWLFFCRQLPRRRKMRFLYHGAFVIFAFGLAALFPFRVFWGRGAPPAASRELSRAHLGLARRFGLRELNVRVLGGRAPAACVTSFSGDSARVIVSSGLNEMLEPEEMGFVIAHELSHHSLRHYPVRVGLAAAALLAYFLAAWLIGRRRDADDDSPPDWKDELEIFLRRLPLYLAAGILAAIGPLAICRAQETEADLYAVAISGDANAGRSALEKLARRLPSRRRNPLEFLSTHPDLEGRIARLR